MNAVDGVVRLWNRILVRTLFELAAALIGRWTVPFSEWLVTRAAYRLPPRMAEECERQWLADLYALPAWLQLRSAVSLLISRGISSMPEPRAETFSKSMESTSNSIGESQRLPPAADGPGSAYDVLTGLFNRRALTKRVNRSLGRFHRHRLGLSVLLVDIDNFESINRELGRRAGDALLRELSRRLRRGLRGRGHIGRFGGDEFAVLLPNTPPLAVLEIAERLRCACNISLRAHDGIFTISASFGVASIAPGLKADELWRRADSALVQAKLGGRNCVRHFVPMAP